MRWPRPSPAGLRLLLCCLIASGVSACALQGAAPTSALPVAGDDAVVRPGDQVSVRIWREEGMSETVRVDQDGIAVFPGLGARTVGGIPAREVERNVRAAYEAFMRDPGVEVVVLRRIGVHGEVTEPSLYMVDLTTTLRELIAMSGGITEAGNPNDIVIVRGGERYRLSSEESAHFHTAELRSGDQVVVGRRSWIARNPLALISTASAVVSAVALLIR